MVVVEVKQYKRCVYLWRLGDCLSPWVPSSTAEKIEMNSTSSLVGGVSAVGSTLQIITWSCLTDR